MLDETAGVRKEREMPEYEGVMALSKLKTSDDLSKIFFELVEENADLALAV